MITNIDQILNEDIGQLNSDMNCKEVLGSRSFSSQTQDKFDAESYLRGKI
jgi:hypothetical protein